MENYKKRQTKGPRGMVSLLAKSLIKKNEMTDQEMCDFIKAKYPDASTTVKCIQYYRYQMRTEGKIPPAKINRRKDKIIYMWETIPGINAVECDNLEGQYTGKQLINKCREVMMKVCDVSKQYAWEELYSVPTCALFLNKLGWDCIEFQTTVKINEYKKED